MDSSSNDDDEFLTPIEDDPDGLIEELKPSFHEEIEDFRSFAQRRRYAQEVIEDAVTLWGEAGILSVLHAIENQTGWALEITAQRSELDDVLMAKYGIYDDGAWTKLKSSDQWIEISREIYEITQRRLDEIAADIAGVEPNVKSHTKKRTNFVYRWLTRFS